MHGPGPESVFDVVPTCRFLDSCDLILQPDGCRTREFIRNLPRDEDGEPLPPDPLDEVLEPLS